MSPGMILTSRYSALIAVAGADAVVDRVVMAGPANWAHAPAARKRTAQLTERTATNRWPIRRPPAFRAGAASEKLFISLPVLIGVVAEVSVVLRQRCIDAIEDETVDLDIEIAEDFGGMGEHTTGAIALTNDEHHAVGLGGDDGRVGDGKYGWCIKDDVVVAFAELANHSHHLIGRKQIGGQRRNRTGRDDVEGREGS